LHAPLHCAQIATSANAKQSYATVTLAAISRCMLVFGSFVSHLWAAHRCILGVPECMRLESASAAGRRWRGSYASCAGPGLPTRNKGRIWCESFTAFTAPPLLMKEPATEDRVTWRSSADGQRDEASRPAFIREAEIILPSNVRGRHRLRPVPPHGQEALRLPLRIASWSVMPEAAGLALASDVFECAYAFLRCPRSRRRN
jgi:hypothetical protein